MYKTCGKFVYETSVKLGKSCARSSTILVSALREVMKPGGKDLFTHLLPPLFPTLLSTAQPSHFTTVNIYFIPAFHTAYNYLYKDLKKGNN